LENTMPLMKTLARFASSRQGRQLFGKAKAYASSPEGKAKIEQARKQIAQHRSNSSKPKSR
jgi:hypothetical protein